MTYLRRIQPRRTRVFVSFDYDKDRDLAILLQGQAKHPGMKFQIENWSLKEPQPDPTWHLVAEARIKRCDVVLVLVGSQTHKASGVLKEVATARRLGVRVVQVKLANRNVTPVPNAGRLYIWTRDNLNLLLAPPQSRAA